MVEDPKVAEAWLDADSAADYERRRFSTLSGRVSQRLDFIALRRSLRGLSPDARILDLPCGTGRGLRFLVGRGYRNLTGADVSQAMLAVAEATVAGAKFLECDASNTKLAADSFDAVFSMRFFGHVPIEQRTAILTELARISGDRVVIEVPIHSRTAHLAKSVLKRQTVGSRLPTQFDWHVVTLSAMRQQAAEARLHLVAARRKLPLLSDSRFIEFRVVSDS